MRILHVINNLDIGGAQKLLHDICLAHHNDISMNITICVLSDSQSTLETNLKAANISIIGINTSKFSISTIHRLIQLMKIADIVHAHLFPTNYLVALANVIAKKPLVFTEHSTHNRRRDHKWLRPIEKLVYSRYNRITCISDATADNLKKWLGSKKTFSQLVVIENGIDLDKYSSPVAADSQEIFGRKGLPLLMVSRLTQSKDHPTVIKAISLIKNQEVFVAFVGDGERRQELENLASELGVADKVIFMGTRTDIPQLIRSSKIGIQSSNWEGFGLTAVEIMAGGLPLIASDVKGLKDVVKDAALLFPKGDYRILASQINQLLSDKQLYLTQQKKGLERAQAFSIKKVAEKFTGLYRTLIG